ncbi:hypothetical protein SAY87_029381 [Trapa incisa]|uniref:RING-type domain-containing protein n=1 Tax=Trapa incisa TaxID=236973 RepID=A0AAN7KCS1_9MYRT|nr:hypothetical protein SAY87_029381 [Trapa incisa]
MNMAKRVAFAPITALLRHLSCVLLAAFSCWGLHRLLPQGQEGGDEEPLEESNNYILLMDGATPSLVHARVLIPLIKKRVPVVGYGEFLQRRHHHYRLPAGVAAEAAGRCAICLVGVEEEDEIRELQDCGHVFHRQCLDCWVDLGHVTCPLCRSLLLPPSSSSNMETINATDTAISRPSRRTIEDLHDDYQMG